MTDQDTAAAPKAPAAGRGSGSGWPWAAEAYTPEFGIEFALRVLERGNVASVCLDADMPGQATIWHYCLKYPEFKEALEEALKFYVDRQLEECIQIADNLTGEGKILSAEANTAAKLQVDTRIKIAEKINRSKYAQKQEVQVTQSTGAPDLSKLTDDELALYITLAKKAAANST